MSIQDNVMQLEACSYNDLPKYCKVFNTNCTEYHLWIYINPEVAREAYFIDAEEIGPNADNSRMFPNTFQRMSQCWIRANREYLNNNSGKHTVKLRFVNRYTDTDFSLYISYIMQNDNPEKPYIYMKDTNNSESNSASSTDYSTFTLYQG